MSQPLKASLLLQFAFLMSASPAHSDGGEAKPEEEIRSFIDERRLVAEELRSLLSTYSTDLVAVRKEAVATWFAENKIRLEALNAKAQRLENNRLPVPSPRIEEVEIPANASEAMERFIVERAQLQNEFATILTNVNGAPQESLRKVLSDWLSKNDIRLQTQQQLSDVIAAERGSEVMSIPECPNIPDDASEELRSVLTLRHALSRDQLIEENRIRNLVSRKGSRAPGRGQ